MHLAGRPRHPAHEFARRELLRGLSEGGAEGRETKIAKGLEEAVFAGFSLQMGFFIPRSEEKEGVRIQESAHRRLGNADDGCKTRADKRTCKGNPAYR